MASSCRFAFAVHVLAVLAHNQREEGGGVCSDVLAGSVNTNPVIIRRLIARLRQAGLVTTQKGSCGGTTLAGEPRHISLDVIYRAIEPAVSFGQHPQEPNKKCPVGAGIERVLDEVFASAQSALEAALARRTLADVVAAMEAEMPSPNLRAAAAGAAAPPGRTRPPHATRPKRVIRPKRVRAISRKAD